MADAKDTAIRIVQRDDRANAAKADYNGLTVFKANLKAQELYDELALRVSGVRAMAQMITGEGLEPFLSWNDDIKQDYLFELAARMGEVENAVKHLGDLAFYS